MSLSPAMASAITAPSIRLVTALKVTLKGGDVIRLAGLPLSFVTKAGQPAETFLPADAKYGSIDTVGAVQSSITTSAPAITVALLPVTSAGVADLCAPANQGSPLQIWSAVVDERTGAVQGDPEMFWNGLLDFATLTDNIGVRTLELQTTTIFEYLFRGVEAQRLNQTWLTSVFPGQTGLSMVIESSSDTFWGKDATVPAYTPTPIAPTVGDRLSGLGSGGLSTGVTFNG